MTSPEQLKDAWDELDMEGKVAAKKEFGSVAVWFDVMVLGKPHPKTKKKVKKTLSKKKASKKDDVPARVYGSDARDQRAFENLTETEKIDVLRRWKDPYAWYLCELTNTIATGLREGFDAGDLAKQYKLTLDEVKQCNPLPKR